jgi:periplasmic copper chaperone A
MTLLISTTHHATARHIRLKVFSALIFFAVLVSTLVAPPASATGSVQAGDLEISQAIMTPTRPGQPSAGGFLTIQNKGKQPDQLIGFLIGPEIAARGELHTMKHENGMMMMREVGGFPLAPGKTFSLKPGGDHLMLIGLQKPLEEGQQVPATLIFEKAGRITVNFTVRKPVMPSEGMQHHKH